MALIVRVLLAGGAFAVTYVLLTRWPRLLLTRRPAPVAALALAAAVLAVSAEGAPTAVGSVDVALRAVLAIVVTAASARARRQSWLFASTATVVAGTGAPLDWFAFLATGAALALLVLNRRSWIVGAFIGACLVQVLLRLDLPTNGTSAMVAAGVSGLLIVSGLRRAPSSTRRRVWIAAGALGSLAIVLSGAAALAAVRSSGDVELGIDAGRQGLRIARQGDALEATGAFGRSADAFGQATTKLGAWWARPALGVPVVGHQLRALRTLSRAGEELAGAASTASAELDLRGLKLRDGGVDLVAVSRAAGTLGSARRSLERAAAEVESAGSPWLVPPLVEAVDDLREPLADARHDIGTAAEVLDLAAPMLGRDGRRRWFVAVVTPAENRGSGGLVGNFAEIIAEGGKLKLVGVERIARLTEAVDDTAAAAVLPPIYAQAYGDWKVPDKLQNVTVVSDFPTAATALEAVSPLAGRGEVDGTVSIDPIAVAALLDVVGPVPVPSWPVPLTAANAVSVLLHEQYVALEEEPREKFLAEVIGAVWARTTTGDLSPTALAKALSSAVRGRHIQLHSRRTEEQAALGRLRADGAPPRSGSDFLGLVIDNASQSKIDWFLRRAVDYQLRLDPGSGSAEAKVKVTLTNDAPPSGLPDYVLGGAVVPPGASRQIVQVYTPYDLVSATVNGRPPPAALRSLGRTGNWAHELDVTIPPKSALTIELRLKGRLSGRPGLWTLDVNRQAAVRPDEVSVTLDVVGGWRIDATGGGLVRRGQSATAHLDLDRNVKLRAEIVRR